MFKRSVARSATACFKYWMNGKSARAAEVPLTTKIGRCRSLTRIGPNCRNVYIIEWLIFRIDWNDFGDIYCLYCGNHTASIRRDAMKIQCRSCGSEYYLQVFIEGREFPYLDQCHCVFCGEKLNNKEVIHHVERTDRRRVG